MATHSGILAWRIPWTEEPGGLQSIGLQSVRIDWATKSTHGTHWFVEDGFSRDLRWGVEGSLGMIPAHYIYCHFVSIFITSALPQITSYQIPEVEDICFRVLDWNQLQPTCTFFLFYFICLFIYLFYYVIGSQNNLLKNTGAVFESRSLACQAIFT